MNERTYTPGGGNKRVAPKYSRSECVCVLVTLVSSFVICAVYKYFGKSTNQPNVFRFYREGRRHRGKGRLRPGGEGFAAAAWVKSANCFML